MVYVTHDQVEAMTLGDRVAVLDRGVLQQVAPPMELYRRPANRFVAGFIGSPGMNFLERGGAVLGIRPQDVELLPTGPAGARGPDTLPATVQIVEPLGSEQVVHLVMADGTPLVAVAPPLPPVAAGASLGVRLPAESLHRFDAGTGERLEV
jgi:multiple sugar transport system ATP-binding protein